MSHPKIPDGAIHKSPQDLVRLLSSSQKARQAWIDITPLARNEWICWIESAKLNTTRSHRINRTKNELEEGKRRPCCWPGCVHRDKTPKKSLS